MNKVHAFSSLNLHEPITSPQARLLRRRGLHRGPEFRRRHRVHSWGRPGRVAARVRTAATRFFSRLEQSVGAQVREGLMIGHAC